MSKINIDVMTHGGMKFYDSLRYEYNPLFKLDMEKISTWVLKHRPLLKYEKDIVLFFDYNDAGGKVISVKILMKKDKHECDNRRKRAGSLYR